MSSQHSHARTLTTLSSAPLAAAIAAVALTTFGVASNAQEPEKERKGYNLRLEEVVVTAKDSPEDLTAAPRVINADDEAQGMELVVQWNVLDNLRLTALTTYRETDTVADAFFNSAGEAAGGKEPSDDTQTEYTAPRLDTPVTYGVDLRYSF